MSQFRRWTAHQLAEDAIRQAPRSTVNGAPGTRPCMLVRKDRAVVRCRTRTDVCVDVVRRLARAEAAVRTVPTPDAQTAARQCQAGCSASAPWPRCCTSTSAVAAHGFACEARWPRMVVRYHQALPPSSTASYGSIRVINIKVADGCGDVLGDTIRVSGWSANRRDDSVWR